MGPEEGVPGQHGLRPVKLVSSASCQRRVWQVEVRSGREGQAQVLGGCEETGSHALGTPLAVSSQSTFLCVFPLLVFSLSTSSVTISTPSSGKQAILSIG